MRSREANYVINRDAIRVFGLYFSKIREFDSKSRFRMTLSTLQAIILGMLLVLTPSALFLTWVLWQKGKLPPHDQLDWSLLRWASPSS